MIHLRIMLLDHVILHTGTVRVTGFADGTSEWLFEGVAEKMAFEVIVSGKTLGTFVARIRFDTCVKSNVALHVVSRGEC